MLMLLLGKWPERQQRMEEMQQKVEREQRILSHRIREVCVHHSIGDLQPHIYQQHYA